MLTDKQYEDSIFSVLPDQIKTMVENSKPPLQKLKEEIKKVEKTWGTLLTPKQLQVVKNQLTTEILGDQRPRFADFSTRGSQEHYAGLIRHRTGFVKDPTEKALKVQQESLKVQQNTYNLIKNNSKNTDFIPLLGTN